MEIVGFEFRNHRNPNTQSHTLGYRSKIDSSNNGRSLEKKSRAMNFTIQRAKGNNSFVQLIRI